MSIHQVSNFIEQGLLSDGGEYADTCLLIAADSFISDNAPASLYKWLSKEEKEGEEHIDIHYSGIVKALWGNVPAAYMDLQGEEFYLTGQNIEVYGFEDNQVGRQDFEDVMVAAHRLGLIAVLFAQEDDHVEGVIPCERSKHSHSWLNSDEWAYLHAGNKPTYFINDSLWSWLIVDEVGDKNLFFYPSPPQFNHAPVPESYIKHTRQEAKNRQSTEDKIGLSIH